MASEHLTALEAAVHQSVGAGLNPQSLELRQASCIIDLMEALAGWLPIAERQLASIPPAPNSAAWRYATARIDRCRSTLARAISLTSEIEPRGRSVLDVQDFRRFLLTACDIFEASFEPSGQELVAGKYRLTLLEAAVQAATVLNLSIMWAKPVSLLLSTSTWIEARTWACQ